MQAKTILVVEDNELNMRLLHDVLEACGYAVLQTGEGMEALKLARQHKPDLILMDINLPEVSGLEVIKWIKDDGALKEIPIIAVTAFAMKVTRRRSVRAAAMAISPSPFRSPISSRPFNNPCVSPGETSVKGEKVR